MRYINNAYIQYINNAHIQYINNVHIQLLAVICHETQNQQINESKYKYYRF
jgi:hypothetical protein